MRICPESVSNIGQEHQLMVLQLAWEVRLVCRQYIQSPPPPQAKLPGLLGVQLIELSGMSPRWAAHHEPLFLGSQFTGFPSQLDQRFGCGAFGAS